MSKGRTPRKLVRDRPPEKLSDNKEQLQRFKEAARELGCDDSEERFIETVRRIAKAPPQHRAKDQLEAGQTRRAVVAKATVTKPSKKRRG